MPSNASASPRLLFTSWHCFFDTSSGAAIATRDLLELLAKHGWSARVLCGPALDFHRRESLPQVLADQNLQIDRKSFLENTPRFSVYQCRSRGVAAAVYQPENLQAAHPSAQHAAPFLALLDRTLTRFRPDVVLTYGGGQVAAETIVRAKRARRQKVPAGGRDLLCGIVRPLTPQPASSQTRRAD